MKGMGKGADALPSLAYLTCKPWATSALFGHFPVGLTPAFSVTFYL